MGLMGVIYFILLPLFIVWNAIAIKTLWAWFLVPLFGLPALSIPVAIGMTLVMRCLGSVEVKSEAIDDEYYAHAASLNIVHPAIAILIGAIARPFL